MCGLFGIVSLAGGYLSSEDLKWFKSNAVLAQRRGSDASGLVWFGADSSMSVVKSWLAVSELLERPEIRDAMSTPTRGWFGHSRLETHGLSVDESNNQPMVSPDWFVLHNGIVTNHREIVASEWAATGIPHSDSDSFALLVLLEKWARDGRSGSLENMVFGRCEGELTVIAGSTSGDLILYTNVGNLYVNRRADGVVMLGSEPRQFGVKFSKAAERLPLGLTVLSTPVANDAAPPGQIERVNVSLPRRAGNGADGLHLSEEELSPAFRSLASELENLAEKKAASVARCARCLLPNTFPNIRFDGDGVCSVCLAFDPPTYAGVEALKRDLTEASPNGQDVLVCLSGGRDSCYVLHLVHQLGFNPVAYTYDWGMVTTAARENMARMCGKLGVEHVLVSPDIQKNRTRVRHALRAWFRKPDIATIPILMAGDKPYFRFAGIVATERGELPAVMADHHLETTGFKSMLAGAVPSTSKTGGVEYRLSNKSLMRMGTTYARSALVNPSMARSILVEGGIGFVDYYLRKHSFVRPFMYLPWDEAEIERVLDVEYGWSKGVDPDLPAWRMGDATAPFYNLVYALALGMTEHDALRSNQIRYGLKTRSEARELLVRDNKTSHLALAAYFQTTGISQDESVILLRRLLDLA